MKGTTHDQEFRCDSSMDEPASVLHVFFDEQVDRTDPDPGRREGGGPGRRGTRAGTAATGPLVDPAGTPSSEFQARRLALAVHIKLPMAGGAGWELPVRSSSWR